MAYKDKEKQRQAQRESMARKRAAVSPPAPAAVETLPPSKPEKKKTGLLEKNRIKGQALNGSTASTSPAQIPLPSPPAPAEPLTHPPVIQDDMTTDEWARGMDLINITKATIEKKGFALWKCAKLNDDIVVVCRDPNHASIPKGYPIYTLKELEEVGKHPQTLAALHRYKVAGVQATMSFFVELDTEVLNNAKHHANPN
jgi:hypothetical protein